MAGSEKRSMEWGLRGWLASLWNGASCRSWDASLKAFCRIEGATSNKKRGAGRWGVRVVNWEGPPYTDPEQCSVMEDCLRQLVLWQSIGGCFWFFTGTVYRGAVPPPSMLRAKGAAIYYSASGRKTCSTNADPVVSLVHYCRFIIRRPKERHAFKVLRSWQTHSRGEANAHWCFRTGTQTDTVQPGTQEQIPDTFWASLLKLRISFIMQSL